jgi:hypothetical protein
MHSTDEAVINYKRIRICSKLKFNAEFLSITQLALGQKSAVKHESITVEHRFGFVIWGIGYDTMDWRFKLWFPVAYSNFSLQVIQATFADCVSADPAGRGFLSGLVS